MQRSCAVVGTAAVAVAKAAAATRAVRVLVIGVSSSVGSIFVEVKSGRHSRRDAVRAAELGPLRCVLQS
jgi:hypothetical protein